MRNVRGIRIFGSTILLTATTAAETLTVPEQFATIQQAIDAAVDGDQIVVSPGVYVEQINLLGKAVTLSGTDPLNTIIDGAGARNPVRP